MKLYYEFGIFQQFRNSLRHAIFTRHADIKNPDVIQKILNTKNKPVSFSNQLHGTCIEIIASAAQDTSKNLEGDVLLTNLTNIPLMIRIADCASILLFDPESHAIGNIHAGWRGLAQKVIHKTIAKMTEEFGSNPENILAAVSPMIGPCCCHFSDPYRELPSFMHPYISKENTVDLWRAVEDNLYECGLSKNHIENMRICTYCNSEDFFSYRRDKTQDRFATAIMLC